MVMMERETLLSGAKALAVITGSLLSGAMASLSLVAVPVLLDTVDESALLVQQWARMYHYGHQVLPGMAVATLGLYGYVGMRARAAKRPWAMFAVAGAITVTMLPFTWIVMVPTNNILFDLEARSRLATVTSIANAQGLLAKWSIMHLIRSLFPLAGAMIGLSQMLGDAV